MDITAESSSGPSQKLIISIFLGTVETHFIQIMCEQRDISTPEVSVFGSENSVHP
jgi:hypothetical protein